MFPYIFNEDLNTLEVFAYDHDEVEKLCGQLFLDMASRLPAVCLSGDTLIIYCT